ncbi:MAG: Jag N-terminal domain-containing protein [Helicobacteraceae bacterium]|nr:Jag N-terminal domain-containing protein [Candidatus Sulfurimonas ponti]MBL6974082.1 Jag N-terminal domain-containing protein [Sulfurimonas sp.]
MIKIEAVTLEAAYKDAASKLECSVTELKIEVVQAPNKGILGLFKKPAIIVAVREVNLESKSESNKIPARDKREALKQKSNVDIQSLKPDEKQEKQETPKSEKKESQTNKTTSKDEVKVNKQAKKPKKKYQETKEKEEAPCILNNTIMPASFVSMQDDEDEYEVSNYLADYDEDEAEVQNISEIAKTVAKEINELFDLTCFNIESIDVSAHDENTLLIEFKGEDAALLIGKEGYRYKALSYMIFNWINTKYQVQLRLEIAEFLKNQEESICKYLIGVCENIDRDGRAQTKILDGVLVQIALNELRERYPDKYIVIRSTRDGLKYIIINDYHSN